MWLQMMMFSIGVYIAYTVWAQKRMKLSPKCMVKMFKCKKKIFFSFINFLLFLFFISANKIKIWDNSWLFLFITYQIAFLIIPSKLIMDNNLPPPCACIILMEQVMKNFFY